MSRQKTPQSQMRAWAITTLVLSQLAVSACGKSEPAAAPAASTVEDAPKAPAAPAQIDAGVKEHMQEHFEAIRRIERAIVVGDTATAREQAQWLADHAAQDEIAKYSDELALVQKAAQALVDSNTTEKMAGNAANLASLCGHCHLVTTSITSFEWTEAPTESGGAKERMQRHLWAMDRLWEGLVGPSEMSWKEGTRVLLAKPFPAEALAIDGKALADAKTHLNKIAELAKEASTATGLSDRARVYGELLGTCSTCHAKTR
jgi:hypothetical protein